MKVVTALIFGVFLFSILSAVAWTTSIDDFVLNVVQRNEPLREIDGRVTVPFDTEYQLLLKNNANRRCVAKVTIDGTPVSSFGDFVIGANNELTLERFITESLKEGPKFKFVPLSDPGVQDPSNPDNGLVRVEFRLEKQIEQYIIPEEEDWEWDGGWYYGPGGWYRIYIYPGNNLTIFEDADLQISNASNFIPCSSVQPGATIEGSLSEQRFHRVNIDLEEKCYILELQIVGY